MTVAYQHLALSAVRPGMILSDDLLDKQGQVLLPKGAVLTSRTIALLPGHGVESLAVLADELAVRAQGRPDLAVIERRLAVLFRKNDAGDALDWATSNLRRHMTAFRLEPEQEP